MDLRWSHEGVSLRAPVRNAKELRRGGLFALGVAFALTLSLLSLRTAPTPPVDFAQCADRANRTSPVCETLRPSFETWRFVDKEAFMQERMCALSRSEADAPIPVHQAHLGLQSMLNLAFLKSVANQGPCDAMLVPDALLQRRAEVEWGALDTIESVYWDKRIDRAIDSADTYFEWRQAVARSLDASYFLWMPVLLGLWLVLLVAYRRLHRLTDPLELEVSTAGVVLDGRTIPRSEIAMLSLEGRRLRIERWHGDPLYSRQLPPGALAMADEICESLGAMVEVDADEDGQPGPAPGALRALMAARVR